MIRRVVGFVQQMKERTGMPYGVICKTLQLPLASLNRWRCRMQENGVLIKRPGPKKVEPFDPSVLDTEIRLLDHGVKRSARTTDLYRRYRFSLSRRELGWMVERVRQDMESDRRAQLRRIEWLTPMVVWAMDFTEYDLGMAGKTYLCEIISDFDIETYLIDEHTNLSGRSIKDLKIHSEIDATVIAVRRGEKVIPNPEPEFIFKPGDVI